MSSIFQDLLDPATQRLKTGAGPIVSYFRSLPLNAAGEVVLGAGPVAYFTHGIPINAAGEVVGLQATDATLYGSGAMPAGPNGELEGDNTAPIALFHQGVPYTAGGVYAITGAGGGGDPFWANVVLLAFNDDAPNGSTSFLDQSTTPHTLSIGAGAPAYSSLNPPPGLATSARFAASGRIQAPNSPDWQMGAGNFCIEWYQRSDAQAGSAFSTQPNVSTVDALSVQYSGAALQWLIAHTAGAWAINQNALSLTNAVWQHIALARNGAQFTAYLNGVGVALTPTFANALIATAQPFYFGNKGDNSSPYVGNLAGFRITKGVARYTANFTPPTLPLPTS